MQRLRPKLLLSILIGVVLIIVIVTAVWNHKAQMAAFTENGAETQQMIDRKFSLCTYYFEALSTYCDRFLFDRGIQKDSPYFSLISYDETENRFSMDAVGGTSLEPMLGNLTGDGAIPRTAAERTAFNLALTLNDYFRLLRTWMPEIGQISYMGEQGFISVYPWVSSAEFRYSPALRDAEFYTVVSPENNPNQRLVWTGAYPHPAGARISLSGPIYYGSTLQGALSLDFTTAALSGLLQGEHSAFLVDDAYHVIASDSFSADGRQARGLETLVSLSESGFASLKQAESGKLQYAGGYLVYKVRLSDAPFTLIVLTPQSRPILSAAARTLPVSLIGVMLVFTVMVAFKFRRVRDELQVASFTDALTGLRNRHFLNTVIETELSRTEQLHQNLSIISFDLDRFKRVNDLYGHPVGDEVLIWTARIARQTIRESDILVRMGGEEFMILLKNTGMGEALRVADRLRHNLAAEKHPVAGRVTASFGVVERLADEDYTSLYHRVDEALYQAKEDGRNCVRTHQEDVGISELVIKLEWNSAWACGEETIDEQHRGLSRLLSRLLKTDPDGTEGYLDELVHRLKEHFDYEEQVLSNAGFPELEQHRAEHERLLAKFEGQRLLLGEGKLSPLALFTTAVEEVIVGHLLEKDIKYFPYLK